LDRFPQGKINYYENILECEYNEGNARILQGIRKPVSMRKISALQLKKFSRKGCPLYAIQVLNSAESKEMKAKDHPVLWEFRDMFPAEVSGLPLKRDLDFFIDLVPGAVPTLKTLHHECTRFGGVEGVVERGVE
jgi:hypothetical protein